MSPEFPGGGSTHHRSVGEHSAASEIRTVPYFPRHEAVVVELGGVGSLCAREQVEKVPARGFLGQQELAVIAAGNDVVTAPIEQLAWSA